MRIVRHGISHARRAADKAIICCCLAVIVVEHHRREIGQGWADSPVHSHLAATGLLEYLGHGMLTVLDVVAIADVNSSIYLVLQLRTLGHRVYLDGLVDSRVDSGILKEVGRHGRQAIPGGLAHAGTFLGIPAQDEVAAGCHILEHLVEQYAFIRDARVEPHTCRATGSTDVVYIRNVGAFADEQTVVAAAPVVVVEICIDSQRGSHRK